MSIFGDIIQSGTANNGSTKGRTPTWSWPSPTAANNLLIVTVSAEATGVAAPTITAPGPWVAGTTLSGAIGGANQDPVIRGFYVDAASSQSGAQTWTNALSASANWTLSWFEIFTGASSALDGTASSSTASSSTATIISTPSTGTLAQADEFLVGMLSVKNSSRVWNNTPSNGFTEQFTDHDSFATASNGISTATLTKLVSSTASTSTSDSCAVGGPWASLIMAFQKPVTVTTLPPRTSVNIVAAPFTAASW